MRNREVAEHLRLVSQLMSLDGAGHFRVQAFSDAADVINGYPVPIESIDPTSIPGIGQSVSACIKQFLETGTSDRLQDLGNRWPISAMDMCQVNSIGPKTAVRLYLEHGIKNFEELYQFSIKPGTPLKPKMVQAIAFAKQCTMGRIPHVQAKFLADYVVGQMAPFVGRIQVCGSIRRKTATSKDVDIVACANGDRAKVFEEFCKLGEVINVGDKKSSIRVTHVGVTMCVDLWLVDPWYWGSALIYASGSKEHCVAIRTLAKSRDFIINEYGIFQADVDGYTEQTQLGGREEGDLYRILNLEHPEPENRDETLRPL